MRALVHATRDARPDCSLSARPRTIENTLRIYDDLSGEFERCLGPGRHGHCRSFPTNGLRQTADEVLQRAAIAMQSELSINRAVYDALIAIDTRRARRRDEVLQSTASCWPSAWPGVDKDDETRRVAAHAASGRPRGRPRGVLEETSAPTTGRSSSRASPISTGCRPISSRGTKPDANGAITVGTKRRRRAAGC